MAIWPLDGTCGWTRHRKSWASSKPLPSVTRYRSMCRVYRGAARLSSGSSPAEQVADPLDASFDRALAQVPEAEDQCGRAGRAARPVAAHAVQADGPFLVDVPARHAPDVKLGGLAADFRRAGGRRRGSTVSCRRATAWSAG